MARQGKAQDQARAAQKQARIAARQELRLERETTGGKALAERARADGEFLTPGQFRLSGREARRAREGRKPSRIRQP
jgi:hypothetical protein